MPKESFLFVPYHAGHHSLADTKLANSDARSHAAAVSRQRRDNRRQRIQLSTPTSSNASLNAVDIEARQDDDSLSPASRTGDDSPPSDESITQSKAEKRVQRRQHMRAMQFSWRAGNVSNESKLSIGLRPGPVGLTSLGDFARSAIDYFVQVINPVNSPIYAIFNVTNIYTSYWMKLMDDQSYRPIGAAMVGAIIQKIRDPTAETSEEVKSNQNLAISRLQKKHECALGSGSVVNDDISIITVLALANLARFQGQAKAYDVHRRSLKNMVFSRGGLDKLGDDGLVAASVSQWDSFWTIQKDVSPLFPAGRAIHTPVYPAFPLSNDLRDTFLNIPIGFQSLILKGKVSVELLDTISRTAEASTNGIQSLSPGDMWHSKTRKHRDFLEACPVLAASDTSTSVLEKKITLALLLYCANTFTSARSSTSLFGASRVELSRLLLLEDQTQCSPVEKECLYWISAVCVDSWRQAGPGSALLAKGLEVLPVLKQLNQECTSRNVLQRFFANQELVTECDRYLDMAG